MTRPGRPVLAGLTALALLAAAPALAHETLHEVARGKAIAVKASFVDGEVLAYTAYEVYSPVDPRIPYQKGRTDRGGWLAFVPDRPGPWRVKVIDDTGHGLDLQVDAEAQGAAAAPAAGAPSSMAFILRPVRLAAALLLSTTAAPALAHHGTASVGALGVEGPGSAIDTASPLPLGQGTGFGLVKTEYVPFQQRAGFTDQKVYASFNTLAVGYGVTPWLSAFVFQPFNAKAQDGVGTNSGLGDTNLMLSAAFKWDEGLRLAPRKESLDELTDWHFSVWASCTVPVGPTTHLDDHGEFYAPDMQTGFGSPSPGLGLAALRQFSDDLTLLVEANSQHFFTHDYATAGYDYRFGGETRLNGALAWRVHASGATRIDLVPELSLLNLQPDQTDEGTGVMAPMQASGGTILYGALGARGSFGGLSVSLIVKKAIAKSLNDEAQQQGSEGLEKFRAALVIGYGTRL